MRTLKKLIAITIIIALMLGQNFSTAVALEVPTAPSEPTAPAAAEVAPEAPTQPSSPSHDNAPSTPQDPSENQSSSDEQSSSESENASENAQEDPVNNTLPDQGTAAESQANGTSTEAVGDTNISTGDATNDANLTTLANNNVSASPEGQETNGTKIVNAGNGNESDNSASSTSVNNSNTIQDNSATVGNNLDQSTTTGKNDASYNVGNSTINTGDANTTGTILSGVNSNIEGVSISEFEVADVHTGDLVLDFAANCIINCMGGSNSIYNTGNGAGSDNNGAINDLSNNSTFQNNDADIANNMTLSSNSGDNDASFNTGGESSIETGNANVSANALTFANNNLQGNVIFGVVDIFGTLIGDIILPDLAVTEVGTCNLCNQTDILAANTNNGANSNNNTNIDSTTNDATFQTNDANIENNLILSSTTGDNDANRNTGGQTNIETGNSSIDANTINIANSNIDGGNWWLVIVNKAGEWVGQLLGAPVGSSVAGSEGTQFSTNEKGEITVTNNGNGAGSDNNATVNQQTNNTTEQSNNANIVNNLDLSANTGGNDANNNTGGNNTIKTGDAKIIANLINFANNNIKTSGKLIVTVVNVFGSWIGDFVTPGSHKDKPSARTTNNQVSAAPEQPSSNSQSNNNANPPSSQTNNNTSSSNNTSNNTITVTTSNANVNPSTNNGSASDQQVNEVNEIKVAGISSGSILDIINGDSEDKDSKTKGISVNLAWLIILIPAGLAYIAIKRKFNPLKFLKR